MKVETYWSHSFLSDALRPDGVIFDFGVNNGGFSRLVASRCREVVGFEPDPTWRNRLSLPTNVRVVPRAVAARAGSRPFHVNAERCSSMHYADTGAIRVDVDAVTLEDALAEAPGARIDLLKMDIEGEEVSVLLEAPEHLFERVAQMTVEFHDFLDASQVPDIRKAIDRMERIGFDAICFSFRSYGDVLFINRRLVPLSALQRLWLVTRFKYLSGLERVLKRAVSQ